MNPEEFKKPQVNLEELQRRFPNYKIRSQPADGCRCNGTGVRHISGQERVCFCVCMSAPIPGEPDYRLALGRAVAKAAKSALDEFNRD